MRPPGPARLSSLALTAILSLQAHGSAQPAPAQQQLSLSGTVVSAASGRPIPGATLTANVADYGLGATTGTDGLKSLARAQAVTLAPLDVKVIDVRIK